MDVTLGGRKAAVITVSDGCFAGTRVDTSGPALVMTLRESGAVQWIPPLSFRMNKTRLRTPSGRQRRRVNALIVTTGGTGLARRDVTPEATLSVCERLVPGLAELIRLDGLKQTAFASLGRGVCGTVSGGSSEALVINVPGSPAGAESSLRAVLPLLPHALDLLAGKTAHGA